MGRISIAGLLGLVAILAVGLAATAGASDAWAGLVFWLMFGVLLACLLAVLLRETRGPAWIGAALFGWGFYLLGLIPATSAHAARLPGAVTGWIFEKANPNPSQPPDPTPPFDSQSDPKVIIARQVWVDYLDRKTNAGRIGTWIGVLIGSGVGSVVGKALARSGTPGRPPGEPADPSPLPR